MLSVIIPVYNEENTILEILKKVEDIKIKKEIIIINDGSTDKTKEKLDVFENATNSDIKLIQLSSNRGKGFAVRKGIKNSKYDIVIIQDADLEYDPKDYAKLIDPILKGKTQIVYGSRILGKMKKSYLRYYLGGRLLSYLTNILFNTHFTDIPTCYKVFKKNIFENIELKSNGFEFCAEITAIISSKKIPVYEVPISYHPRSFKEGKKISSKDGLIAIYILLKYRFFN